MYFKVDSLSLGKNSSLAAQGKGFMVTKHGINTSKQPRHYVIWTTLSGNELFAIAIVIVIIRLPVLLKYPFIYWHYSLEYV